MAIDEGYIKFDSDWTAGSAADPELTALLDRWRRPLFDAGLIGHYDEIGVGYGNLSLRAGEPGQFIITGTQTGHLERKEPGHYALVTKTDIVHNTVWSTGPGTTPSRTS